MIQENKDLLFKDLCARLPYGVKIKLIRWDIDEGMYINTTLEPDDIERLINDENGDIEIEPYLRPMSSMTEEEKLMYEGLMIGTDNISYMLDVVDRLNAHHFDYRGLIDKSLALDATGLNIYN